MREQTVKDIEKEFLEPSFRYLVKNGLENTSVRDLCRAMNISYGSLYYWFDGKDDIYISVVRYGIQKVAQALFSFTQEMMAEPEAFFSTFINEVEKYKLELRLIFQFTTSPVYGDRMRDKALDFKEGYDASSAKIAKSLGLTAEEMLPVIYMLISILVDFVVWEDRAVSDLQMQFLYQTVFQKLSLGKAEKYKQENSNEENSLLCATAKSV